ncbi:MAG: MOSC domain-containing protein [Candidatus Margulisiibacteriota bacterium]|nr:MOSC domain-containing protein [Candidatus Margulisiibacteriota bacterium]
MSKIKNTCINGERGQKSEVASLNLVKDKGIAGDYHARGGNRQISLLADESIQKMRALLGEKHKKILFPGAFGENIITEGIDLLTLKIGQSIKINQAVLEISKIGKDCPAPCEIHRLTGKCIMPTEGIFAKVLEEGTISKGDKIDIL